ncbi:MAG: hypothetical protein V1860_02415 [bacterium]
MDDKFKNNIAISEESDKKGAKDAPGNFWDRFKKLARRDNKESANKDGSSAGKDVNFVFSEYIVPPSKEVARKAVIFITAIVLEIAVIALLYLAMNVQEKASLKNLQGVREEKNKIDKKIAELGNIELEASKLHENIAVARDMLNNHIYWDEFFKVLEKYTLSGVYYETADLDRSGQIKLDAIAENFDDLAAQTDIFLSNKEYFKSVEISSVTLEQDKKTGKIDGVKFFIDLEVNPDIFYKKL